MKKQLLVLLIVIFFLLLPSGVFAHSGRTDSSGGHNCSAKSIAKGLCTGYHYHNGGSVRIEPLIPTYKPTIKPSTPRPTIAPTEIPTSTPEVLSISTEALQPTVTPKVEVQGATTSTGWLLPLGLLIVAGPKILKWLARKTAPTEI